MSGLQHPVPNFLGWQNPVGFIKYILNRETNNNHWFSI